MRTARSFSRTLQALPDAHRWSFWIGCALAIKLVYFAVSLAQGYRSNVDGSFAVCTGDCSSYLDPIDHLVSAGAYDPDFRMPGYGAVYLPLRWMLDKHIAMDVLILLQVFLDALAVYALALGLLRLTGARHTFLVGFFLYGLGCTISGFNIFILTESLCASALCFTFYFTVEHMRMRSKSALFLASCMITWAYFMRPVMVVFAALLAGFILVHAIATKRNVMRTMLIFLLPICLVQFSWTLRNYLHHGKVFLLNETPYYPTYTKAELASWKFVATFDNSTRLYFFPDRDWANRQTRLSDVTTIAFPADIYTEAFTQDSLEEVRRLCARMVANSTSLSEKHWCDSTITARLERYTTSIKRDKKWMAYVRTPLGVARQHVLGSSGVYNLFLPPFGELGILSKVIKLFCIAIYLLALYGALLFVPWSLWRWDRRYWSLVPFLLYGLLVHPVLIGMGDVRYLYVFFPVMCICAGVFYSSLGQGRQEKVS